MVPMEEVPTTITVDEVHQFIRLTKYFLKFFQVFSLIVEQLESLWVNLL